MYLYIDPGTGSMLVTIIISLISTVIYASRGFFISLKQGLFKNKEDIDKDMKSVVIFSDDKRYWNVFEPICLEFEKRKKDIYYYTMSEDDLALKLNSDYIHARYIGSGNKAFWIMNNLHANICLSTTPGLDVYQWKRSKYVNRYIHIMHTIDELLGYKMFGLDFYDEILTTGQFQEEYVRKIEALRMLKAKKIHVVGSTYLDVMAKRYSEYTKNDTENSTKTILLAPSWGKEAIFSKFGDNIIDALISTGYRIIIRPHPQSYKSELDLITRLTNKYPESENIIWDNNVDNFESLCKADIMITDFSSVMFDFCFVFNKPLIYANVNMDDSQYDACWLDEPVWRLKILPDIGHQLNENDFSNIKLIIDDAINNANTNEKLFSIKEYAWQYKGESVVNTVDYLLDEK